MRCPKCGTRNAAASRYCRQCGEPLAQAAAPAAHGYQDTAPQSVNIERARWFAERGDTDTAIQISRGIVEEHPDSAAAHLALAQYLARGGFEDLANTHFEIAAELDPRVRADPHVVATIQARPADRPEPRKWAEWAEHVRRDFDRLKEWLSARPKLALAIVAGLVVLTVSTVGMTVAARSRAANGSAARSSSADTYLRAADRYLAQRDFASAERMLESAAQAAPDDPEVSRMRERLERAKGAVVEVLPEQQGAGSTFGLDVPRERPLDEPLFGQPGMSPESAKVLERIYGGGPLAGAAAGGNGALGARPAGAPAAGKGLTARGGGRAIPSAVPPPLGEPRRDLLPALSALGGIETMGSPQWTWTMGPRRPGSSRPAGEATGGASAPVVEIPAGPSIPLAAAAPEPAPEAMLNPSRSIAGSVRRAGPGAAAAAPPTSTPSAPAATGSARPAAAASSGGGEDRALALLEQAQRHQALGLEYQRQGQWAKARGAFRQALQACDAAEQAGCTKAATGSVRSSCGTSLKNVGS